MPHGVVLHMRPASSIDVEQAQTESGTAIREMLLSRSVLNGFGIPQALLSGAGVGFDGDDSDDDEEGDDVANRFRDFLGLSSFISSVLLFEHLVSSWENVVDENDHPLELNRITIGRFLLHKDMKVAFDRYAYTVQMAVSAEGNESAVSQPGSGEAEQTTAPAAKN